MIIVVKDDSTWKYKVLRIIEYDQHLSKKSLSSKIFGVSNCKLGKI